MAITNTRTVQRVEVQPEGDDPIVFVVYTHTFDDPNDDQLPAETEKTKWLNRYTVTVAEDGTETSAATDISGEDAMVQAICGAVWTD